jgi:hypothetical protein
LKVAYAETWQATSKLSMLHPGEVPKNRHLVDVQHQTNPQVTIEAYNQFPSNSYTSAMSYADKCNGMNWWILKPREMPAS